MFNAQLPFDPLAARERARWHDSSEPSGVGGELPAASKMRMFAGDAFNLLGYTDAFTNLRALQKFANAVLREKKGYYYVMRVDGMKLSDVDDITVREDAEDAENAEFVDDVVVLDEDHWGERPGYGNRVRVHGLINVEAIDKIWVAQRDGPDGNTGAFTDCTFPGSHNPPPLVEHSL